MITASLLLWNTAQTTKAPLYSAEVQGAGSVREVCTRLDDLRGRGWLLVCLQFVSGLSYSYFLCVPLACLCSGVRQRGIPWPDEAAWQQACAEGGGHRAGGLWLSYMILKAACVWADPVRDCGFCYMCVLQCGGHAKE